MATNPRPPHRDFETFEGQKRKRSAAPWIILGILAACALFAAFWFYLPRVPRQPRAPIQAATPAQPTGKQIRFSNLKLAPSPAGGQLFIYGRLWNTRNTAVNGVLMEVTFTGKNEKPVGTVAAKVEGYKNQTAEPLATNPIQPNESREIRIDVEHVPAAWNHQMPELKVQDVTAVGH